MTQNLLFETISSIDGKTIFSYSNIGIFITWNHGDKFKVRSLHTGNIVDEFQFDNIENVNVASDLSDYWVEDNYAPYLV